MVVVTMAVGFEIAKVRGEIEVEGVAESKKAAKADAYRNGMTRLKQLAAPERYRVIYSVVAHVDTAEV